MKGDVVNKNFPVIVIVGGGFGGLAAAKALKNAPARVIVIDRNNHHIFQPLLYQVATAVLTPGQIGAPIRGILRNQPNTSVFMGEVIEVDRTERCVVVNGARSRSRAGPLRLPDTRYGLLSQLLRSQ